MWVPSWPGEFVVVLTILTSALRQEKEMDIPQIREEGVKLASLAKDMITSAEKLRKPMSLVINAVGKEINRQRRIITH